MIFSTSSRRALEIDGQGDRGSERNSDDIHSRPKLPKLCHAVDDWSGNRIWQRLGYLKAGFGLDQFTLSD